ncbi:MAG: translocation/assembly module TamB domain-containing protein [Syntrophobacteraceae bacterium]
MFKWIGIVWFAFLLLLGVCFLLLQTETVKKQLSTRLSMLLSSEPDRKILVGGIKGWIPLRIRLARFSISDDRGVWLDIRDLVFECSPRALLSGRLEIPLLAAAKISIERLPSGQEEAGLQPPEHPEPFVLPEGVPPVSIKKLAIAELHLGRELAGQSAVFQVAGKLSASFGRQGISAVLEATRSDHGPQTRLDLRVSLDGRPKELNLHASFHEDSGGWLAQIVELKDAGELDWYLDGNGPLASWTGTLSAGIAAFGSVSSTLRLSAAEAVELALDGKFSPNETTIPARWQPLFGKALHFGLDLTLRPERDIAVRKASITGAECNVLIEGELDLQTNILKADLDMAVDNLKALTGGPDSRSPKNDIPGTARMRVRLAGDLQKRNVSAEIAGDMKPSMDLPEEFRSLLGSEVRLSTRVEVHGGSRIEAPVVTVDSYIFGLTGKAYADLENKNLRGNLHIAVPDLNPLTSLAGKPLSGEAQIDGEVEGWFDSLNATLSASGENVALDKLKLGKVTLDLTGKGLPAAPRGKLSMVLKKTGAPLTLSTDYALDNRDMSLSSISFAAPGNELSGRVRFDLDSYLTEGKIDGHFKDFSLLGGGFENTMTGSGVAHAVFSREKGSQNISLQVSGRNLASPEMKLAGVTLTADLQNIYKLPTGTLDCSLSGFQRSKIEVSRFFFKAKGNPQEIQFQGEGKGKAPTAFDLQMRGRGLLSEDFQRLRLETLTGRFGEHSIALMEPLGFERASTGLSLEKLAISFGKGSLAASGWINRKGIQFNADFKKLPLDAAALPGWPTIEGSVAGEIDVSGRHDSLQANAKVQIDGMHFPEAGKADIPSIVLTANNVVSGGNLIIEASLAGLTEEPARAELKIPVAYSLTPFSFFPVTRKPCQGRLTLNADLARLTKIVPLDAQKLSGKAAIDLDLGGKPDSPEFHGAIALQDGSYENYRTGTVLKDLSLDGTAEGTHLRIAQFEAGDGGRGKIRAEGTVDLNSAADFPLEIRLTFAEATVVRRSDVTGAVTGDLTISGPVNALKASGSLEVGPMEIKLPERLPPEMTSVKVIEINEPGRTLAVPEKLPGKLPVRIALDIRSNLPGRIFVRGWGINSEWQGNLQLAGTVSRPQLDGNVSSVRGRVDFLNKRFNIVSGSIRFFGQTPPDPFIDLTAECKTKEITAQLVFSGTVKTPKLTLQSDPPLPQDEILARLLFGREATQITPVQALRLAMVAKSLTVGGGRQLDFISHTRDLLGLDDLQFDSAGRGLDKGTVGIGKYLTEGVYVDLEKGVGGNADKASVEIEVTPHLSLESEIGSDKSTGIGANYRIDY